MRGGGVDSGDVVGGEMGLYSMKSLISSSRSSSIPKLKPRSIIGDGGRESSLEVECLDGVDGVNVLRSTSPVKRIKRGVLMTRLIL